MTRCADRACVVRGPWRRSHEERHPAADPAQEATVPRDPPPETVQGAARHFRQAAGAFVVAVRVVARQAQGRGVGDRTDVVARGRPTVRSWAVRACASRMGAAGRATRSSALGPVQRRS